MIHRTARHKRILEEPATIRELVATRERLGLGIPTWDILHGPTGMAIEVNPQNYPHGRFARLQDSENNPMEPWQPAGGDAPH